MVILLHGEDTFRLMRRYRAIREHSERKGAELAEYDFDPRLTDIPRSESMLRDLKSKLQTRLLFQDTTQFFVIRRLEEQPKSVITKAKKVLHADVDRSGVVILFLEHKTLAGNNAWYKHLHGEFEVKEESYRPKEGEDAVRYVRGLAGQEFGVNLDSAAAKHLLAAYNFDLFGVWYGLHTVCSYYADSTRLFVQDIEYLLPASKEEKIFELSRALLERDSAGAVRVLFSLERQGQEGLQVAGFLISQIKKALFIKDLRKRGYQSLSSIGGNPKAAQILERQACNLSFNEVLDIYLALIELDHTVKHGEEDIYPALHEFFTRAV